MFFALDFQFRSQSTTLNRLIDKRKKNTVTCIIYTITMLFVQHSLERDGGKRVRMQVCIAKNQCQIIINKKIRKHSHSWKSRHKIQIKQRCYRLHFFLVENKICFVFICLVLKCRTSVCIVFFCCRQRIKINIKNLRISISNCVDIFLSLCFVSSSCAVFRHLLLRSI